jgi:ribose/xylose/arabinose/galactoside ABC-type transport system permease subunit
VTLLAPDARSRDWRALAARNAIIPVFLLFVLLAGIATGGRFLQPSNISIILFQSSVVGVLVLGQTLVMLVAGIDLSIVAVAILAAIVIGAGGSERQIMMNLSGVLPFLGFWQSIAIAIAGAALIGMINGIAVVAFRIPPFIATLAMSLALSGLAMIMTGGGPVHYPDPFYDAFGQARFLGLPLTVHVFLVLAVVLGLFLTRSSVGIEIYAIGGNSRAARLSGIPVGRITILAYTLCGLLGGIAGFLFLARTGSVAPMSGGSLLLGTIAAVVVGGVSLTGGKGSILNAGRHPASRRPVQPDEHPVDLATPAGCRRRRHHSAGDHAECTPRSGLSRMFGT